jgi:hypothetical protein
VGPRVGIVWGSGEIEFLYVILTCMGRDSSFGIATRYGLDGPGIESRWWARFSSLTQTDTGAHPVSYTMGTGPSPGGGVKRPERGVDHPPHLTSRLRKE